MAKVLESRDPNFKEGDLVWGVTGWEEYSVIEEPQKLFKIHHSSDVPLSYYTGILGNIHFGFIPMKDLFVLVYSIALVWDFSFQVWLV